MSGLSVEIKGLLPLKRQLELLVMTPSKRHRVLNKVANKVRLDSLKRVSTQMDLQGVPYAPRQKPRRRKMLSKMVRKMSIIRNDGLQATIGFRSYRTSTIAAKQQFGATEQVSARRSGISSNSGSRSTNASRKQAKALRDLGFKADSGKANSRRTVGIRWITDNVSAGQAGAIIRTMRIKQGTHPKSFWTTTLPARSFLGATPDEVTGYIDTIFETITEGINHGAR